MKTILLSILLLATTCFSATPKKFGWIGDDGNKFAPSLVTSQWPINIIATSSDITNLEDVLNQLNIGSCVAHGVSTAWDYAYYLLTKKHIRVSRLQIYWDARAKIGTTRSDSGCQIVDAVNNMQRIGAGEEKLWPYIPNKFTIKPPTICYTDAKKHIAIRAFKVDNTDGKSIRLALTNGYPVIVGSLVYKGIMGLDKKNYILPYPKLGEKPIGGHCYLIKGSNDNTQLYTARNSWDKTWGNKGDFLVPYKYIHNGRITEDCWVIVQVTQ